MPQRITILPETLANKIAAGEVVERPSSVIKELIENSLDAGATDIRVEIAAGGRRLIKITDNGHGMSRDDAMLSLERHATSKIMTDSDLDEIQTLGFRGEALPSIASVSRLRLATREQENPEGSEIFVEGGKVREVRACGMAPGTIITVEQLFYNIPARHKFMKSADTEAGHVSDSLVRMAVSRPDVAFTLVSDGQEMLKVQKSDLLRRLTQTLGKNSSDLHRVDSFAEGISVTGFISGPANVRSNTAAMFTYINGRFVRDRVIQHAVLQAYRGVTDRGRYPVMALFIKIPAGEVDVNVHPTKHEVRFRRQALVHDTLQRAIEDVLRDSPWLTKLKPSVTPRDNNDYQERILAAAQTSLYLSHRENRFQVTAGSVPESSINAGSVSETADLYNADAISSKTAGFFSSHDIIGQFHGEYILCQSGQELVIIDQHAASERVAYQRLRQQSLAGGVESQRLLFSETIEISFSEAALTQRYHKELFDIGFELEPFGGNTVILSAVPRVAAGGNVISLVRDILAELGQLGASSAFQDVLDHLLARIACHSVVRGVHTLDKRQIAELLRSMDGTDFAATCPHGRPVIHTITLSEIEKIFKRT